MEKIQKLEAAWWWARNTRIAALHQKREHLAAPRNHARELSTGNAVADHLNTVRLAMEPEYWALIDYLSSKGLLDEKEFVAVLSRHLNAQVDAVERATAQKDAE